MPGARRLLPRPLAAACALGALACAAAALLLLGALAVEREPDADAATRAHSSQVLCPQQFGSFGVGHWPPACWRPYGPSSPFNRAIPPNPRLAPESRAITAYMSESGWTFTHDHGRNDFSLPDDGSRPVYWSRPSDPLVRVRCVGDFSCVRGLRLRIPAGAQTQEESDGHMTVVDQVGRREYDFWNATSPSGGEMTAAAASSIAIGTNSGTGLHGDGEASYLGLLGGLIRAPELASGRIEHALAAAVPCVQWRDVWPAPAHGRGDSTCEGRGVGPHLGSLLQLDMSDAQIAASGAPAWERAIMTAMAHYGIYVVDTNGAGYMSISLIEEDDQSFRSFGFEGEMSGLFHSLGSSGHLVGVPLSVGKLRAIAPCVPHGTC